MTLHKNSPRMKVTSYSNLKLKPMEVSLISLESRSLACYPIFPLTNVILAKISSRLPMEKKTMIT